MIYRQILW